VKDLYTKKYKTLMNEIIADTNNAKACHTIKTSKLSKWIYMFIAIPIKISWHFLQTHKNQSQNSYGITKDPE